MGKNFIKEYKEAIIISPNSKIKINEDKFFKIFMFGSIDFRWKRELLDLVEDESVHILVYNADIKELESDKFKDLNDFERFYAKWLNRSIKDSHISIFNYALDESVDVFAHSIFKHCSKYIKNNYGINNSKCLCDFVKKLDNIDTLDSVAEIKKRLKEDVTNFRNIRKGLWG